MLTRDRGRRAGPAGLDGGEVHQRRVGQHDLVAGVDPADGPVVDRLHVQGLEHRVVDGDRHGGRGDRGAGGGRHHRPEVPGAGGQRRGAPGAGVRRAGVGAERGEGAGAGARLDPDRGDPGDREGVGGDRRGAGGDHGAGGRCADAHRRCGVVDGLVGRRGRGRVAGQVGRGGPEAVGAVRPRAGDQVAGVRRVAVDAAGGPGGGGGELVLEGDAVDAGVHVVGHGGDVRPRR